MVAIVGFAVNAVMTGMNMQATSMRSLIAAVVGFLVGAAIYGNMLAGPGGPIGMGKGALVSLVAGIVQFVVWSVLILLAGVLFAAGGAVAAA